MFIITNTFMIRAKILSCINKYMLFWLPKSFNPILITNNSFHRVLAIL